MNYPINDRADLINAVARECPGRPDLWKQVALYTRPRGWWISAHLSKWRVYVHVGSD